MEALALVDWMKEKKIDPQALGGDSTNPNTGWQGGTLCWVEKLLGKKKCWVICTIHCNELPLRHLIVKVVGQTKGKDKFSGPIGDKLYVVNDLKRRYDFTPIPGLCELPAIPEKVVSHMSKDSSLFYLLGVAIRTGYLPVELGNKKCGTLVHSRWLTTGTAILLLYCSDHGLDSEEDKKLTLLATFTLQVYHQMFWEIKVKHSIVDAPRHILTNLSLLRRQDQKVREIVTPYICSGAWFAHSEAVLLTLVSSSDREERQFRVKEILRKRGDDEFGDLNVRPHRTPKINLEATTLASLISWENDIHEPVFTAGLSRAEVLALVDKAFNAPYFPSHTQSTE